MKLLFVNACVNAENSRTLALSRFYIEKFVEAKEKAGEVCSVHEVNLDRDYADGKLLPLTGEQLAKREELKTAEKLDDPMFDYAHQFLSADYIVIGAPFWDLNIPALLRIYLERVSVPNLTYAYDEHGIPARKSRIRGGAFIMTAGGPTTGMNYGYEYVNGLFRNLFCLPELALYKAEMLDVIGTDVDAALAQTKAQMAADC